MTEWSKLTLPQRIVWLFENRCSEAHREKVCHALQITGEQFDSSIARARDLGCESGIWLTPIYERAGWWTGCPTDRIIARANAESGDRNIGEASRNRKVAQVRADAIKTDTARRVASGATLVEMAYMGAGRSLREQLPEIEIGVASDYVIERVDSAIAEDRGFVPLSIPVEVAA